MRRFLAMTLAPVVALATAAGSPSDTPAPGASREAAAEEERFFETRIRPLLFENCQSCHGARKQEAGLRLDSWEGILKGADTGPVVVPGNPQESPLIEAVGYGGPTKMPPRQKLPDQAIADLTRWVQNGARWPQAASEASAGVSLTGDPAASAERHWAFQPVGNPPIPQVTNRHWLQSSIDPWILSQLEAQGLTPSPPADRRTLIRRASFDLLGLPPTPEEIEAFVADPRVDAYPRLIERLLASAHYGERWGRYWLDLARYSDTRGYVFFQDPEFHWAYTYRDYVIRSLNADLPFDRFLLEQLAADRLVTDGDQRPLAALGFLTLGGRFMNNFHDVIDDRIDVVTRGLMGLTVTCARCHDHKYDPIPSRDYYALYGVFASSEEPTIPPEFLPPPKTESYAEFSRELTLRANRLVEFVAEKHRELVASAQVRAAEYLLAAQQSLDHPNTQEFMLIADGGDLNPKVLLRWQALIARTRKGTDPVFAPWHALASFPTAEFADRAADLCAQLSSQSESLATLNPVVVRALADEPPQSLSEAARIYARIFNQVESLWQDAVRRATLNGKMPEPLPDPALEQLRLVFHGPDAPPDIPVKPFGDLALLPDRPSQAKLKELRDALQEWLVKGPGAPPRAITLVDSPEPVEPRVFVRGNPNQPGETVSRQLPGLLASLQPGPFRDGSGRLELARAIVHRQNPLTARVLINRIWMHHFGAPLVATPGDFGTRSDPPTHPDLLDHLASVFMDEGWSLKAIHRRIMLSSTYQQSSDDRPECRQLDPENRLYWRMNRRRLDFEATRDALLAVSGRLERSIGGPSFPTPADPSFRRRTLYARIDRLNLPGIYRTFDFPDPNTSSPRRDQTTVPPQALFLMNNPFARAAAEALANHPKLVGESHPLDRVERLFGLVFGREPTAEERLLVERFQADQPDAWVALAHALLLANEFVFVD